MEEVQTMKIQGISSQFGNYEEKRGWININLSSFKMLPIFPKIKQNNPKQFFINKVLFSICRDYNNEKLPPQIS